MNKTLALIAALGLFVAAPAFAADSATTGATAGASTDAASTSVDAKTSTSTKADAGKTTPSKLKPAAGKHHKKSAEKEAPQQ